MQIQSDIPEKYFIIRPSNFTSSGLGLFSRIDVPQGLWLDRPAGPIHAIERTSEYTFQSIENQGNTIWIDGTPTKHKNKTRLLSYANQYIWNHGEGNYIKLHENGKMQVAYKILKGNEVYFHYGPNFGWENVYLALEARTAIIIKKLVQL